MDYSKLHITYVEHLSVVNHLVKSMEDVLISRARILALPLLIIDVPLFCAVALVNIERTIYTYTVDFLIAHLIVDIQPVLRRIKDIIPEKYHARLLGDGDDDTPDEDTWTGKIFQFLHGTLRFTWALFVFALFIPVWPIVLLYNFFIEYLTAGLLYYALIFFDFRGWEGTLLYGLIFGMVTFLVASISVPFLLRIFTYVKHLFSLEKKSWKVVNHEAHAAFLDLYLTMQENRIRLIESAEARYRHVHTAKGGVYYLVLKTLHTIKEYLLMLRKRRVTDMFESIKATIEAMQADIADEKDEYDTSVRGMQTGEIVKTTIALALTFAFSIWLAREGLQGHNMLAAIFLSFTDEEFAMMTWWNYTHSQMGYYEYLAHSFDFVPGFVQMIAAGVDYIWGYFFKAYYYALPTYLDFLKMYYGYVWEMVLKLF